MDFECIRRPRTSSKVQLLIFKEKGQGCELEILVSRVFAQFQKIFGTREDARILDDRDTDSAARRRRCYFASKMITPSDNEEDASLSVRFDRRSKFRKNSKSAVLPRAMLHKFTTF